jgi:hypothetical protein
MNQKKLKPNFRQGEEARQYGRFTDVERIFGIKRTTAYALLNAGKIRGCSIVVGGRTSRVRLIDLASVDSFIQSQMTSQEGKV